MTSREPRSAHVFRFVANGPGHYINCLLRGAPARRCVAVTSLSKASMRFTLIDRVVELSPGARITAVKNLSMAEEYLADHFPGFPVMPGVLMLEAMTQAAAWLVRSSEDFAHSMVVLKEARNVKYASFVEPGQTLSVTAEIVDQTPHEVRLKASGSVAGVPSVSARLVLSRYNLADEDASRSIADQVVKQKLRELFSLLYRPTPATV